MRLPLFPFFFFGYFSLLADEGLVLLVVRLWRVCVRTCAYVLVLALMRMRLATAVLKATDDKVQEYKTRFRREWMERRRVFNQLQELRGNSLAISLHVVDMAKRSS